MRGLDGMDVGPMWPDHFSGSRSFFPSGAARPAVAPEDAGPLCRRSKPLKRMAVSRRAIVAICCGLGVLGLACGGGYIWISGNPPVAIESGSISGGGSLAGTSTYANYAKLEDIPKRYRKYIWQPDDLPAGLTLDIINVVDSTSYIMIKSSYSTPDDIWLSVERIIHRNATGIRTYSDKDTEENLTALDPIHVDGVELRRYHGVDNERVAFLIRFFHGESTYIIDSNLPLEAVEGLAKECLAAAMAE